MYSFKQFRSTKQAGQAIVLIAMLMVILLAATGLAVDGGGMFLLYRDAQNAADAAALNAAFALCTGGDVSFAGLNAANLNGFKGNETDTFIEINNPPSQGDHIGDAAFVEVVIEAEKPSYFIGLVYPEALVVEARTEAECQSGATGTAPTFPIDAAIFAANQHCGAVIDIGTNQQTVYGNIHSNYTLQWSASYTKTYGSIAADVVTNWPNIVSDNKVYPDGTTNYVEGPGAVTTPSNYTPMPQLFDIADFLPIGEQTFDGRPGTGVVKTIVENNGDTFAYYSKANCNNQQGEKTQSWFWNNNMNPDGSLKKGVYVSWCQIYLDKNLANENNVTFAAQHQVAIQAQSSHTITPYYSGLIMFSPYDWNPTGSNGAQCGNFVGKWIGGNNITWTGLIYIPNGRFEWSSNTNSRINGVILADVVQISGSNLTVNYNISFLSVAADVAPSINIRR